MSNSYLKVHHTTIAIGFIILSIVYEIFKSIKKSLGVLKHITLYITNNIVFANTFMILLNDL